jgi:benzoylformate decarboxylase
MLKAKRFKFQKGLTMTDTKNSPKMPAPRRGAALMVEVLRSEGVEYVFGNPGTTELPLVDELTTSPDLSYVLGLHEACVVAMADGYAQASGRPGFVNLHTAGGLGHAMGSILNARASRTPLVITTGQQDTRHGHTDPLLHGDLLAIAGPVTKWAREVQHPEQIPVLVRRAFQDSAAAPSGPVFLSLPIDVMERITMAGPGKRSRIERAAVAGSLEALADALARVPSGRLALIAGDEVFASNASAEVVALAEAFGAPVFGSSWPAHIPFPTAHELWAGSLPTKAAETRATLGAFDAVLALGGHSAITYLYSEGPAVPADCDLFQISADAGSLGRTYPTTLSCIGDLRASLGALLPLLRPRLVGRGAADLRDAAKQGRAAARAMLLDQVRAESAAPVTTPLVAAAEVARAIGPDVAIVDESVSTTTRFRAFLHSRSSRQYSFLRGATLGWGIPAAVGTSLGLGREPVVAVVGDGAALYAVQALWTAAHEQLPVTVVVMNNREYAILKNFMRSQTHYLSPRANRFLGMDITDPAVDFLAVAAGMGVPARRVECVADIAAAVEAGIASGRPNLIEVPVLPG